jgi:hypothetical protein
MDLKKLEKKLQPAPQEFWMPLYNRLLGLRQALEETAELYAKARKNYQEFKSNVANRSLESLQSAKDSLAEREKAFKEMLDQWRQTFSLGCQMAAGRMVLIPQTHRGTR